MIIPLGNFDVSSMLVLFRRVLVESMSAVDSSVGVEIAFVGSC